jgi:hypothetical protein
MQYVLDPRLLPPGGASVQCTRCGHVFMASPHGTPPPPKPAPAVTGQGGAPSGTSSTQIFGGGRSPMMSTQLFGSGPHPKPTTDGASATPVPNATQAFGAVPPVQPAERSGTAVPPPPAVAPISGPRAQGAAAPGNATQTFGAVPGLTPRGTPAQTPGTAAGGNATQTFGAVPAHGGSVPGNATQTFGAVPAQGTAAPSNLTQTFGAVPAHTAAPPGNATQTFGAVPAQGAMAPGNGTQTFGAVPAHGGSAPGNGTQTFGAVPAHGGSVPGNATQTFGAVPAHGGSGPGNATQTFGAVSAHGAPAPGHGTQTFGAVPAHGAPAPGNATQTFGAVPAADAPAPLGRSQTFSAVSAPIGSERVVGVAPVSAQAPGASPQTSSGIFPARTPASSHGATQAFGAVPAMPPPGTQAPIGKTQAFGAVPAGTDAGIQLPPESPAPVGSETLLPFGPGAQRPVEPVSGTASTARRAPVELPPELLAASRSSASIGESFESERPAGRERLMLIIAITAGLIMAAVLAYPAWRDRHTDMPAAAVEDKDRATALLRRDDSASREQAIQRLRALSAAHPKYTEAQAELAVALSLRLSDVQAEIEQLRLRTDKVNREKAETQDLRDAVERQMRLASQDKQLADLAAELAPLRTEADTIRKDLDAQVSALASAPEVEPAPALVARLKARAIHAGVTVAPDALALAERLRNAEGTTTTWSTLARVEYALASGSPPDSLMSVAQELATLRQEDRTLSRAYLLGARLALRLNDQATARSLLDDVLALNPKYQQASRLLSQLAAPDARP